MRRDDLLSYLSNEIVRRKYDLRYEPAWQIYVREEQPESKADLIVDNRDIFDPKIIERPGSDTLPDRMTAQTQGNAKT